MTLPAPNLDDRRFQELVDDAKRLVMRRCPDWTDHNVSDPGVTLIETFAYMTDLLMYRLNRVPDRLYVKFLELIGVRLYPPTPAAAPITFWLSAPAVTELVIPPYTMAQTLRGDVDEPVVFSTTEDLHILPCALLTIATQAAEADFVVDTLDVMRLGNPFKAFQEPPAVGDTMLIGLTEAVPRCAVELRVLARVDGVGVDPDNPPLVWEAFSGSSWDLCEVETDGTGGLNRDGVVVIHVPRTHQAAIIDERRAGWIRCRVVAADEGQPQYSSPPEIRGLEAGTVGGTSDAINAEIVSSELLGESEGVAGQRFPVSLGPVLAGAGEPVLEVSDDDLGWVEWTRVAQFWSSGPDDKHFVLDATGQEVIFGPTVRESDGRLRAYGAVPPKGASVRIRDYAVGGGRRGNVGARTLVALRSTIPFVSAVENRRPATGGVDPEDIEEAKVRGPLALWTRTRAVTAQDFEYLVRDAAPEIARVRAMPASTAPEAGTVRVLVVPAAPIENGKIRFEDLVPSEDLLQRVTDALDRARLIGTRVLVEPPLYQGLTVVAQLVAKPRADARRIQIDAQAALDEYVNPLTGGKDGTGWEWGRPVLAGEIFGVLQSVKGVDYVEDVRLFGANPITGERGQATNRLDIEPGSLVFSYAHQIRVDER
jgi:predicted phage baseplate assembly protein